MFLRKCYVSTSVVIWYCQTLNVLSRAIIPAVKRFT